MTESLQEFVDCRGAALRVDRAAGLIRGVKILGLVSRNGRDYLPEALDRAAALYEGAKVNVNHPQGSPASPRDYRDRIGVIRNVGARPGEGLFGDLLFNPKHALAEQLAWDAEHAPENVGFSHNVEARTARRGDRVVVEAITRVQSVDLVADPATTRGLFECAGGDSAAVIGQQSRRIDELEAEIDRLKAAEAAAEKRLAVRRLLAEHGLPEPDSSDGFARSVVSEQFVASLLAAPDAAAMRRLVEDRAALVRGAAARAGAAGRPLSRERVIAGSDARDVASFVRCIT